MNYYESNDEFNDEPDEEYTEAELDLLCDEEYSPTAWEPVDEPN